MLYGKLDLYIWKRQLTLVLPIFLVLFILFFASTLGQLAYNFNEYDLPIHFLPKILLAKVPELILLLMGISLYIGIIVSLSSLNSSQETVSMMTIGLGRAWFIKNTLLFVSPFLIVITYVSFFIMPNGFEQTRKLNEQAKAEINLNFDSRTLKTYGHNLMTYVDEKVDGKNFKGLLTYSNLNGNSVIISAQSGKEYRKNGSRWLRLNEVMFYDLNRSSPTLSYAKELDFSLSEYLSEKISETFDKSVRMQSTYDLLNDGGPTQRAELFWRLSFVVSAVLFCLLAVFIARYQPRKSAFVHVFPALILFLVYSKLLTLVRQKTEQALWSPELGYGGLYLLFSVILYLLWLHSENKLFK